MKHLKLYEELINEIGDSNPLGYAHIDLWHEGQYKVQSGDIEEGILIMNKAAQEAETLAKKTRDAGIAGEANYYRGTIAWLKKDYETVKKLSRDKWVKLTGNDEVLKRLLKNRRKPYHKAYKR